MKIFLTSILAIFLVALILPNEISAKKKLPQINSTGQTTSVKRATGGGARGVTTKVKFRSDRLGIIATFSNLDIARSVSYSLTYRSRGIQEGAGGSLTDLTNEQTRELLFGTCSKNVCRYHTGIKNAVFTVTTTLPNNRKVSKRFRLRV